MEMWAGPTGGIQAGTGVFRSFVEAVWSLAVCPRGPLPGLTGGYVVLGSGPGARAPEGGWEGWKLAIVNGSGRTADALGAPAPDLMMLGPRLIPHIHSGRSSRENVVGRRARHIMAIGQTVTYLETVRGARELNLHWDEFTILGRRRREGIVARLVEKNSSFTRGENPSSGVLLAMVCLASGAGPVLMSGFSLTQSAYFFDPGNQGRAHVGKDRLLLGELVRRGYPIFTNDPAFAAESTVPMWPAA
jgi:hypothetical protein